MGNKKKEQKSSKESTMNIAIIQKAIDLFKSVSDLSQKVIDAADPEKYAKSVNALNQGVSDSYDAMRKIIMDSDKFSDEEKLERLSKLAEQEEDAKRKCGEAIKGNREHVSNVALEIVKGLLTCGISFVPAITKNIKASLEDTVQLAESAVPLLLEETEGQEEKNTRFIWKKSKE